MCTNEVTAYENPDGGRPIFGYEGFRQGLRELKLPCGTCPECCKSYYTQWATRGSRELSCWESSLFITLTYDDDHLPGDRSLKKKDVQNFIKRVKKYFNSTKENPIRQTYCGEYGSQTLRPHYHVILYNADFSDKKMLRISPQGHRIFTSEKLTRLWGKGLTEFGFATPASISYLYKYILKKKTRREKEKPLTLVIDGITYDVEHEFIESSRNPGIGAFLRDSDSLKKGYLSVEGVRKKLPKYYLEYLRIHDPESYDEIQQVKFDFMKGKVNDSPLRKKQKAAAQKKLTDTKKRL